MKQMCERREKMSERSVLICKRREFVFELTGFPISITEQLVWDFVFCTQNVASDGLGLTIPKTTHILLVSVSFLESPLVLVSCVLKVI